MHICERLVHEKIVTDDHVPARVWQYIAHEEEQLGVKVLDPASRRAYPRSTLKTCMLIERRATATRIDSIIADVREPRLKSEGATARRLVR